MRLLPALALFTVLAASTALAQTPAPQPADQAPPAAAAPADMSHMKVNEVRAGCREDGKAQGLKGKELRASVKDCLVKARPDLAAVLACRDKGKAQGLSGQELKDFVKKCKKGEQ